MLMKVINEKEYEEFSREAKLHGIEIKTPIKPLEMTKEERSEADKQAQSLLERLKKRHEEHKRKA